MNSERAGDWPQHARKMPSAPVITNYHILLPFSAAISSVDVSIHVKHPVRKVVFKPISNDVKIYTTNAAVVKSFFITSNMINGNQDALGIFNWSIPQASNQFTTFYLQEAKIFDDTFTFSLHDSTGAIVVAPDTLTALVHIEFHEDP